MDYKNLESGWYKIIYYNETTNFKYIDIIHLGNKCRENDSMAYYEVLTKTKRNDGATWCAGEEYPTELSDKIEKLSKKDKLELL